MGTKNNPGNFDCFLAAHPDEPMFIVLGRDPIGGALVRLWACARPALNKPGDDTKIAEAVECATSMDRWCESVGRKPVENLLDMLPAEFLAAAVQRREGWRMVPAVPTEAMKVAGGHANSEWLNDNAPIGELRYMRPMESVWRDMLAAAPAPA